MGSAISTLAFSDPNALFAVGSGKRIVPLIVSAHNKNLPYQRILKVLLSCILFPAIDANGSMIKSDQIFIELYKHNTEKVMQNHCKSDTLQKKSLFIEA
jgi:hypothetical protein